MAKRRKVRATKSKTSKRRAKTAKTVVKRAVGKKSRRKSKTVAAKVSPRRTSKKVAARTARTRASRPKNVSPPKPQAAPIVQGEIIDVIDEPVPGVMRVTEIEETRVTVRGADDDNEE